MTIQTPEPVGFVVTLKDVYDQMQAGFNQVHEMRGQLGTIAAARQTDATSISQLQVKVSSLEASRNRIYGALVLLSVLFGGGGLWVALSMAHR